MINLFDLSSNDQSVAYLGQIFGYVGSVLPVNQPNLLVGLIFKILNTTALTIGAILVVYVTVVGLLKTAQEGEFLGRQWNSLWVPLRTVMGIAALFPTSSGYSAIQVVIMWIVLQSIGAADTLWTQVLKYISVTGSPYASVGAATGSTAMIALQPAMKNLFQNLVCQASAKASYPDIPLASSSGTKGDIKYYCGDPAHSDEDFCKYSNADMWDPISGPLVTGLTYSIGPSGECGSLTYCNETAACTADTSNPSNTTVGPNSTGCVACKAQKQALRSIVPVLGTVASKIVALDNQYATFHEYQKTVLSPAQPIIPDWIQNYCDSKGAADATTCCVYASDQCKGASIFPPSSETGSTIDLGNMSYSALTPLVSSRSLTDLSLQYPLAAYLNGADFVNAAIGEYMAALVGAVSANIQQQMDQSQSTGWYGTAQQDGWIFAGVFYYKIAGMNQKNIDAAILTPTVTSPANMNDPLGNSYRNNYNAASNLLQAMTASNASSTSFTNTPGMTGSLSNTPGMSGDISHSIAGAGSALLQGWTENLSGNGSTAGFNSGATNPLIGIASFGYTLMLITEILFAVLVVTIPVVTALTTINPIVLGTGLTLNPIGEGVKALFNFIGPFFMILMAGLFSIGAMLGIYVPLIPFMIFALGAIGWLIATIEAMVAGPIIALGILSPGGQHDILGRAEPALMQLFNLFLRPSLMIVGMMISMFLAVVVVKMINAGFVAAALSIANPGLVESVLLIAIYTSFIVTAMNKVFSLIYVIPERITTWIGGHAVSYGEEQAIGASKQALEGAAGQVSGAAKESGAVAAHAGESMALKGQEAGKAAKEKKAREAGSVSAEDEEGPGGS